MATNTTKGDDMINPDGFDVRGGHFGPSYRDGQKFNNLIYMIRPELVELNQVEQSANRQSLEEAFCISEQHLTIPKLLEPQEISESPMWQFLKRKAPDNSDEANDG